MIGLFLFSSIEVSQCSFDMLFGRFGSRSSQFDQISIYSRQYNNLFTVARERNDLWVQISREHNDDQYIHKSFAIESLASFCIIVLFYMLFLRAEITAAPI